MFGIDFYPTPREVVDRMLMDVEVAGKYVLEPSAGSGNIVKALKERGAKEVIACEIDPRLRKVLSGECTVIADDFLTVTREQVSHIDLIVMNPPFSQAERHFLHAVDIAPEECEIISLCNSEMLVTVYSRDRKRIKEIIAAQGFADSLGSCFKHAERGTDCDISCIHVWMPRSGSDEFDGYFDVASDEYEGGGAAGIMPYNAIRDIVSRYVEAVRRFDAVEEASREINALTSMFDSCPIKFGARWRGNEYVAVTRETFKKELQKSAWNTVFNKMDMDRYVTAKVRANINRFVERQTHAPFTMHNIFRMLEIIVGTHGDRMQKVLEEAFEMIASFSAENSTAGEKWKTNSDYMINKRFIVPNMTDAYGYSSKYTRPFVYLSYGRGEKIDDIIRALCFLMGRRYTEDMSMRRFFMENDIPWGEWATMGHYETRDDQKVFIEGFFRIRGYKKGTMHFEFLDDEVWAKFNIEVAKGKGWQLPKMRTTKMRRK